MDKINAYEGIVLDVFVGIPDSVQSIKKKKILLTWEGIVGDRHFGRTKIAGVRENYVPKGTEVMNQRQVSIISKDEIKQIAERMELDSMYPEDLGVNILIDNIKDFSRVPFGSIMQFEHCANILLTGDNFPCIYPGYEIDARNGTSKFSKFAKSAMHIRGQTGMCLRPGVIKPKSTFKIIIPKEVSSSFEYSLSR